MTKLRLVTANVDFTLRPYMVKEDLKFIMEHADVITFQEAKRVDIDALITDDGWGVYQPMATDATKGSGVAWRKEVGKRKGVGKRVGTRPFGRGMLTRYIAFVRLEIDGRDYVFASMHMPPKRFWGFLYNNMLKNVEEFVKEFDCPVIVGSDWNKIVGRAVDLVKLGQRVNGKMFGVHIDGFLIVAKRRIKVIKVRKLRDTHSDHDPVQVVVELDKAR